MALQKGAQQGGEFSCSILRREDLQGRDWDEESVSGGGQADNQEVNGWKLMKGSLFRQNKHFDRVERECSCYNILKERK